MLRIHIFHTGKVRVDQGIPYREKNPLAVTGLFRGKDKKIILPVSCYLIEHPKGNVLIDTGWDPRYVQERPNAILDMVSAPILCEGESVDCKLKALGLSPSDLDYIFFSHMDFDHTSGLRVVKDAKRIMAAEEEIADSKKYVYRYVKSTWNFTEVMPFSYSKTGVGPVGRSYDVFGDGSILLIHTPGHTHGLFSARISNGDQYVLLVGDTAYTQRSMDEKILPGFTVNTLLAKQSLDWVCQCRQDKNCLLVAPNHDPAIEEQTIEL